MKLENKQTKPADIGTPSPQMSNQIFFQCVGRNFFPKMREGSGGFSNSLSLDVIGGRQVGPIVIEKGTDMEQVMNVEAELLQIAGKLRGTIDVSGYDMKHGDAGPSQVLLGNAAGHFVEVGADQR